jgi:hypothetical protein
VRQFRRLRRDRDRAKRRHDPTNGRCGPWVESGIVRYIVDSIIRLRRSQVTILRKVAGTCRGVIRDLGSLSGAVDSSADASYGQDVWVCPGARGAACASWCRRAGCGALNGVACCGGRERVVDRAEPEPRWLAKCVVQRRVVPDASGVHRCRRILHESKLSLDAGRAVEWIHVADPADAQPPRRQRELLVCGVLPDDALLLGRGTDVPQRGLFASSDVRGAMERRELASRFNPESRRRRRQPQGSVVHNGAGLHGGGLRLFRIIRAPVGGALERRRMDARADAEPAWRDQHDVQWRVVPIEPSLRGGWRLLHDSRDPRTDPQLAVGRALERHQLAAAAYP